MDYSKVLNRTLASLPPSGIRRFFDIANEVKADDMISLSIGEPDFATPWHIREKGIFSHGALCGTRGWSMIPVPKWS